MKCRRKHGVQEEIGTNSNLGTQKGSPKEGGRADLIRVIII